MTCGKLRGFFWSLLIEEVVWFHWFPKSTTCSFLRQGIGKFKQCINRVANPMVEVHPLYPVVFPKRLRIGQVVTKKANVLQKPHLTNFLSIQLLQDLTQSTYNMKQVNQSWSIYSSVTFLISIIYKVPKNTDSVAWFQKNILYNSHTFFVCDFLNITKIYSPQNLQPCRPSASMRGVRLPRAVRIAPG